MLINNLWQSFLTLKSISGTINLKMLNYIWKCQKMIKNWNRMKLKLSKIELYFCRGATKKNRLLWSLSFHFEISEDGMNVVFLFADLLYRFQSDKGKIYEKYLSIQLHSERSMFSRLQTIVLKQLQLNWTDCCLKF